MLTPKQFCQMAWVVDDLDGAVEQWRRTAGIGPFFVGAHIGATITGATHRGRPCEIDMSVAIAQAGPVQIELIHQHGDAASPYRDAYTVGESGFHHIMAYVDDVEAEIRNYEKNGYEVAMSGTFGGETPFAYMDTRPMTGAMTELMDKNGPAARMFAAAAAAAVGWDGTDPIRDITTLMS